jgi:protein tyrosine/serine phosphatase
MLMIDDLEIRTQNSVDNDNSSETIPVYQLLKNYPNPFNPSTTISFSLSKSCDVNLDIYNIKGQKIKSIVDSKLKVGKYDLIWNGDDEKGATVSSGIYFYRLTVGQKSYETGRMVLLK